MSRTELLTLRCQDGSGDIAGLRAHLRHLIDLGVRCPEDVSLIGVDDLDWADVMRIRPTLIAQPIEAMTRTAIAALLEQLTTGVSSQKRRILFPPKLTERESCAPPALY